MQAQYPADANPGEDGARTRTAGGTAPPPSAAACGRGFDHGTKWASRLPAEFPAYPGGRLTEAAGNDHGGCRMRVVSFTTTDAPQRVLERYRRLVTGAGYTAEQQQRGADQVLGGNARRQRLLSDRHPAGRGLRRLADRQQRAVTALAERGARRYIAAMPSLLLVMLGGALGAGARHLAGAAGLRWLGPGFPWGTLFVNLLGSLLDRAARRLAGPRRRQRAGAPVPRRRRARRLHHLLGLQPRARPDAPARRAGDRRRLCPASVIGGVLLLFAGLWLMRAGAVA